MLFIARLLFGTEDEQAHLPALAAVALKLPLRGISLELFHRPRTFCDGR